jgi:nitrogenase-associated protein
MSGLLFYEKPGCVGNAQQKALLRELGIAFTVRDLLSESWTLSGLRPFFGRLPVAEWFNRSAPAVKSGEVDIHTCSEGDALRLMLQQPLLIRRPLLQLGELYQSGFVQGPVLNALGVRLDPEQDMQSCPMEVTAVQCGEPA